MSAKPEGGLADMSAENIFFFSAFLNCRLSTWATGSLQGPVPGQYTVVQRIRAHFYRIRVPQIRPRINRIRIWVTQKSLEPLDPDTTYFENRMYDISLPGLNI